MMYQNSNIYDYLKPQIEVIMSELHSLVEHLDIVYAYCEHDNKAILYVSKNANHISIEPNIETIDQKKVHQFCVKDSPKEWYQLNEIPFVLEKMPEAYPVNLFTATQKEKTNKAPCTKSKKQTGEKDTTTAVIQHDLSEEAKRNALCIRIKHPYDDWRVTYIIAFRQDLKHWLNIINVLHQGKGLNYTAKDILQSFIYNMINNRLDSMLSNKRHRIREQQITADVLARKTTLIEQQHNKLQFVLVQKIESIVPDFFNLYSLADESKDLLIKNIDKPYISKLIQNIDIYMRNMAVYINQQKICHEDVILIEHELCTTITKQCIETYSQIKHNQHKTTKAEPLYSSDRDKLIHYLDMLEHAAEILQEKQLKITANNLIEVHPKYSKLPPQERPSNAAISMYLNDKHKKYIIYKLFAQDPENTKWRILRSHFHNLKQLDEAVKKDSAHTKNETTTATNTNAV